MQFTSYLNLELFNCLFFPPTHHTFLPNNLCCQEVKTKNLSPLPFFRPFCLFSLPLPTIHTYLMAYNAQRPMPPPPPYVMLAEQGGANSMNLRPPPNRRNLPRYHSEHKKGNECCKCFCWCFCFLFIFILAIAAALVYLFLIYKPKIPSYSVAKFSVGSFEFRPNELTLHTKLFVSVRAENPNEMIGIKYGEGSNIVIAYRNSTLSAGKLPSFYQGHKNVTVMEVTLEGTHPYGSGLQKAIEESSNAGSIPLDVYVRVPFSLKLDSFDLREVTVNVHCALVVDSISPTKKPNIKSTTYDVSVDF